LIQLHAITNGSYWTKLKNESYELRQNEAVFGVIASVHKETLRYIVRKYPQAWVTVT